MITWHLETILIKNLRDHPKNPREIKKEQLQHLENLIKKFGLIDKPLVNLDNTIIGGHQRVRILKKMKVKEVQCWIPDRMLTDEEVEHLLVAHNLNQGQWNWDALANMWEPLDLLEWGFSEEQLVGKFSENEEIEGKEEKSKNKKKKECPACGHEF